MPTYIKKNKISVFDFFPPPKYLIMPSVGVDISDNSIKFVELKHVKKSKELLRFGKHTIPEGVVSAGEIKDPEKFIGILKEMKKKYKLDFVRVSLPEEKVYLFKIQVPDTADAKQIRSTLEFKLEEHVPLSPKESIFDYEVVKDTLKNGTVDVSVAVYPKKIVDEYSSVFKKAKLTPLSFETEAQAVERSVVREGDHGTYIIVDFGRGRTGLSIVSHGVLTLTSTLDIKGKDLNDLTMKHMSLSEEESDKVNNESGLMNSEVSKEFTSAMLKIVERLSDEIDKYVDYWHSRTGASSKKVDKIEKIILCGGSSNLAGLPEYLSGSLKIPTEIANVWGNILSLDDTIPEMDRYESLSYATAVGLALRDSN